MYYTLYTSSDYYEEDDNSLKEDNVKICLICWLPNKNKDLVQNMKNFSYILTTCDCNALFHSNCLKTWISNSHSCPICRKQLTITTTVYNFQNHIKFFFFFFIFHYISAFLQIIHVISIVNLFLLYFYIIYIILLFNKNFNYEIYF
jgi:hypothetical protein